MTQWRVWTEGAEIITESGQVGGKMQRFPQTAVAKNVGRANETTPEEQAELEAQAKWTFKRERKYHLTPKDAENVSELKPMLACKFKDRKHTVSYPVDVQPKLDGLRMLAFWNSEQTEVLLFSRGGKYYKIAHLSAQLAKVLPKHAVLDGEIYAHGLTLQTINSLAKRNQPGSKDLCYYVYDMPCWEDDEELPWRQRRKNLTAFFESFPVSEAPAIREVVTVRAESEEQVMSFQQTFVDAGFEGAMVRLLSGRYEGGYYSTVLLKVKSFQDDEFKVVGYAAGKGKFADKVIFTCETNSASPKGAGIRFDVVPKGTDAIRSAYLKNGASYVGKKLTVRFFNYTPDGKPFLPVGVAFRLKEDMPK